MGASARATSLDPAYAFEPAPLRLFPKMESFPEFLAQDPPPDLQALATEFGGLSEVPIERWHEFQRARRDWNMRRLWRHEPAG